MKITRHAMDRGRERLGLNDSALQRTAAIALDQGFRHADTKGQLHRYCDRLFLSHGTANNLRIHGEQVFLFSGVTLITVHPVPHNLRGGLAKLRAQRLAQ
jgi:hypothetical protein